MNYILILCSCLYRLATVNNPLLSGISPLFALSFLSKESDIKWVLCSNALVDTTISLQYGVTWLSFLPTIFAAVYYCLARFNMKSFAVVIAGTAVHYLVTNTLSWIYDPLYQKTLAGWMVCNTVGNPMYPPTIFFFLRMALGNAFFYLAILYIRELKHDGTRKIIPA